MSIRLNPIAEKSASISVHMEKQDGKQECIVAPAKNAASARAKFHLTRGETCEMTNIGTGKAYVYVTVDSDVEVVIGSETDKLRPAPKDCGSMSQMYTLQQGVEVVFRAV